MRDVARSGSLPPAPHLGTVFAIFVLVALTSRPIFAVNPPIPRGFQVANVQVLFDMEAVQDRLLPDLQEATREIYVDFYIFGGDIGRAVSRILKEKKKAGLDVRVLFDRYRGTLPATRKDMGRIWKDLVRSGVPVQEAPRQDGRWFSPGKRRIDHNKLFVIDGKYAYAGGMNLHDIYWNFHDLMVRFDGGSVDTLRDLFLYDWGLAVGSEQRPENPEDSIRFPEVSDAHAEVEAVPAGATHVRVLSSGVGRSTVWGPFIGAIRAATTSIRLAGDEVNHPVMIQEIIQAQGRGVDVRILVDPTRSDAFVTPKFDLKLPEGIISANAIHAWNEAGVPVRFFDTTGSFKLMHLKYIVVDEVICNQGSTNHTKGAFSWTSETNLEMVGEGAREVGRRFDQEWARGSPARVGSLALILNKIIRALIAR